MRMCSNGSSISSHGLQGTVRAQPGSRMRRKSWSIHSLINDSEKTWVPLRLPMA